jgi:Baseplate J-like protein
MAKSAPLIDQRTAEDVADQVKQLLRHYLPEQFNSSQNSGAISEALIQIFARYSELIIQRLNQVPDKNFLAFLNLLGASQLPPQPARVPLTFSMTTGTVGDVVVPAGTQVAALPQKGEQDPVVFESEQELVVTATQLRSLLSLDPVQDRFSNHEKLLGANPSEPEQVFRGNAPLQHIFYLGHRDILGYEHLETLDITWTLQNQQPLEDDRVLQWEMWNGEEWEAITPSRDETNHLRQSGKVSFSHLKTVPATSVHSISNRWLRGTLQTPVLKLDEPQPGKVRAKQLPVVTTVSLRADLGQSNLTPEAAFTNTFPVDFSKPFFPLGEKPTFGDTFYLACPAAFKQTDARISLNVKLMDRKVKPSNIKLVWEYSQGQQWVVLGTSTSPDSSSQANTSANDSRFNFNDGTSALTKSGLVEFTIPADQKAAIATINGVASFWLRVRIEAGNYGVEAQYDLNTPKDKPPVLTFKSATFAPPCMREISIAYQLEQTATQTTPEAIALVSENNFQFTTMQGTFTPFQPSSEENPGLYLGFEPPPNQPFPQRVLSLYVAAQTNQYQPDVPHTHSSSARLIWEYWDGLSWQTLTVEDGTRSLTHSGLVELLMPETFCPALLFGIEQYWLRIRWEQGSYGIPSRLQQVLLNTMMATQSVTVQNELLGSSNGSEHQVFHTTRSPVLAGQVLEVKESESWMRWEEVPDFYGSSAGDRHYVLHHLTGEVLFGNGRKGRIPPIGVANIRMAHYQSGGGSRGNRAFGTIVELKTTLPYIDRVTNPQAAAGGADAETMEALKARAPRMVRHGGRAVTLEDYEDLAMLASPEVARVMCIPLKQLSENPLDMERTPGTVSVLIVPESQDVKPLPSLELLDRVQNYLSARALSTVNLEVVGPLYVKVALDVEVSLTSLEEVEAVKKAIHLALQQFLHPLRGGFDGRGWPFGRAPHRSDFYALLEAVPRVDHVRSLGIIETLDRRLNLAIAEEEDLLRTKQSGRFLVYSGTHNIKLTLAD